MIMNQMNQMQTHLSGHNKPNGNLALRLFADKSKGLAAVAAILQLESHHCSTLMPD